MICPHCGSRKKLIPNWQRHWRGGWWWIVACLVTVPVFGLVGFVAAVLGAAWRWIYAAVSRQRDRVWWCKDCRKTFAPG